MTVKIFCVHHGPIIHDLLQRQCEDQLDLCESLIRDRKDREGLEVKHINPYIGR